MISIINIDQSQKWDEIVKNFTNYDIYYLSGYVKAFMIHGDGNPQLLYFEIDELKAIYVYMKRETFFEGVFDSITPYGYGGVLFEGILNNKNSEIFWTEYIAKMKDENIVDSFVRFHPILSNSQSICKYSNVIHVGNTVAMELNSPDTIWNNITSKNRNTIRKADKNGVEIINSDEYELFKVFISMYNATMYKDNAEKYYFFNEEFYDSIYKDLHGHYTLFYATYKGKIIAMSIILFANKQMHYHLSGSLCEYRYLAPTNLLLYKAALWGVEKGFKTFHLGGGVGSSEDNLYKFKAAFNRYSNYQFSIAKDIFNKEKYDELVRIRANSDSSFNSESLYFPLYRS